MARVSLRHPLPTGLLSGIIYCLLFIPTLSFKAHEFKKCNDAHFCKRNREKQPGPSPYTLTSGQLDDGRFLGTLRNTAVEGVEFSILVAAYRDGIMRVKINEEPSKDRFEVPGVIEPDLESKRVPLAESSKHFASPAGSTTLEAGVCTLLIASNPFSLTAYRSGQPILAINSKGLFNFEHRRAKQEGDEPGLWEETFRSHTDSKPKGPEAISFDLSFFNVDHVYGIPEHATSLALRPTRGPSGTSEPYRLYNLDVFEYEHDSPFGLYGSIPVMLAHAAEHTAGFFWLNAAEMWVDVLEAKWDGAEAPSQQVDTHWIAEAGILDAFLFLGPSPKAVVQQYSSVTGTTRMPPLFAIGYHQCRWNYKDEGDVAYVDASFDHYDIPYDTLWLDIEHTDGKKYMTWDSVHFPTPERMQKEIGAKGRHMVTIVDPHVKRDAHYALHTESTHKGFYVKDKNGNDFDGWCWPGSSSYLDVVSPEIRAWWAGKFAYSSYRGSTPILHIWNDMNEPSVFNGPEVTMHKDNLHYGGVEHREVHNAYGYYYHMATAEGLLQRDGGQERPFVLSRAAFAGTQKVGAIWTGDNTANWDHLRVSVPMLLTLGLSGIAFSGADVGGFFHDPDAELMVRWFQLGAFYPFFRGHAHLDTKRREPWIFGEPYTSHIREAIRLRYALLPYLYTLFREAAVTGVPVMRPLFLEFPQEAATFEREDCFLLGPALLVRPVTAAGARSTEVYFPGGALWYHVTTGQAQAPGVAEVPVELDTVLAFQRAGTILPRKDRPRRSSTQMALDPYTLVVALDANGEAQGELYVDDGHSYAFRQGAFLQRRFWFARGVLHSADAAPPGSRFATPCTVERVVVLGLPPAQMAVARRALRDGSPGQRQLELELEEELGPPFVRPGIPSSALIVRLPNVPIAEDWSIHIVAG